VDRALECSESHVSEQSIVSRRENETESTPVTLIGLYRRIPEQPHRRQATITRQCLVTVVEEVRVLRTITNQINIITPRTTLSSYPLFPPPRRLCFALSLLVSPINIITPKVTDKFFK